MPVAIRRALCGSVSLGMARVSVLIGCFCRQRETLGLLVRCSLPLSQQIALQISTGILIRANNQESLGKRTC